MSSATKFGKILLAWAIYEGLFGIGQNFQFSLVYFRLTIVQNFHGCVNDQILKYHLVTLNARAGNIHGKRKRII